MSVPTSNLYNFVAQVVENKFLIKYFYPWGQKDIANLVSNVDRMNEDIYRKKYAAFPVLICHDQEPLDFDMYSDDQKILNALVASGNFIPTQIDDIKKSNYENLNLRWQHPQNFTEKWTLLHSELASPQVERYEDSGLFACAYWWSHAAIARDWYRYAQYDQRLELPQEDKEANWLVYARGTTGTRQYRQHFLKLLRFVDRKQLGSIDPDAVVNSNSSAEYNCEDFAKTNCSIVLETVYDGRIHLTEKTLRPIACGHPFMILNGAGTLKYLRSYGFETFSPFIDESYDTESDCDKRMLMVIKEMDRINNLPDNQQESIWNSCKTIASKNKTLFFSDEFFDSITQELRDNVLSI